jgi:hypothetical protein
MLQKIKGMGNFNKEVLAGLLAHEFGHVMQMTTKCYLNLYYQKNRRALLASDSCFRNWSSSQGDVYPLELLADFMAGWTLARLALLTTESFNGFGRQLFRMGDDFTDTTHHGRPRERLSAMANGFDFGRTGKVLGFYPNEYMERGKKKFDPKSVDSAFAAGQATLAARL